MTNNTQSDPANVVENDPTANANESKLHLEEYISSGKDQLGNRIQKILSTGPGYIIYEIQSVHLSESIRVDIIPELSSRFSEISKDFNEVKAILYKAKRENSFKQLIASAVSRGLLGEIEGSKEQLKDIAQKICIEYRQHFVAKMVYFGTIITASAMIMFFAVIVYLRCIPFFSNEILRHGIYAIAFSGIGCSLSIAIKLKGIELERGIDWYLHVLYAIERLVISHAASVLAYIMIKSDMVFGFLNTARQPIYGVLVICAIAGFSEKFIPDLLKKIETTSVKTSNLK